jgi:4-hydroxybenzoate polyprenyltransferase
MRYLFISMRPQQWTKNLVVLAALVFSQNAIHKGLLAVAAAAFLLFCVLSGSVYLINDAVDAKRDKWHPVKKHRPIAAGLLDARIAVWAAVLMSTASIAIAFRIGSGFAVASCCYLALQILYSFYLKHFVIVDVLSIAAGFVLRVVAGAAAIHVPVSHWILSCTLMLALFLGLAKRRHELKSLKDEGKEHRKILTEYSIPLLDQMISIVASVTVVTYTLYTISPETIARFGTDRLIYTVPFLLYGLFRYLFLIYERDMGGAPDAVLLTDKPLIACIFSYLIAVWLIIYVFHR